MEPNKEEIEKLTSIRVRLREKIFPILNKIDNIWEKNPELQFCEIVKMIDTEKYTDDLLLTKRLDELIDGIEINTL